MKKGETEILKDQIKKQYAKIALSNNNSPEICCTAGGCCGSKISVPPSSTTTTTNIAQIAETIGYTQKDLQSIPQESILGVGCGAPLNFAEIKEGETVIDLGSGAGIDVFLSANHVGAHGKIIGIDMTDEMLERARKNAKEHGYTNVEFRSGDIEKKIPVDNETADLVISNCVINLTTNKVDAFKEIHRVLKSGGSGRMVISDLVTSAEVEPSDIDSQKWCGCIDGALTKEHYLDTIRKAGFKNVEVLSEQAYIEGEELDDRKITSLVIRAMKA
jgi:SAM-dependent methyltransferase